MITRTKMTIGVTILSFFNLAFATAAEREVSYYTIDTDTPMTQYQLYSLCQHDADVIQGKVTEVSTRLTGNAHALQVIGHYGQSPSNIPHEIESWCYFDFRSFDHSVGWNAYSAVHYTHLNASTWDTACKPVQDQLNANPNTIITQYIKSATLIQGRICEVTTVNAEKAGVATPAPTPLGTPVPAPSPTLIHD